MTRWQVTLRGKWGGSRTITITAHDAADARRRARELAYGHEMASNVCRVGLSGPVRAKLSGPDFTTGPGRDEQPRDAHTGEELEL